MVVGLADVADCLCVRSGVNLAVIDQVDPFRKTISIVQNSWLNLAPEVRKTARADIRNALVTVLI